jgi:hypothetical protein
LLKVADAEEGVVKFMAKVILDVEHGRDLEANGGGGLG